MNLIKRNITKTAVAFTLVVAGLVLIGWIFNVPALKTMLPAGSNMKFNTALCFLLSAVALLLSDRSSVTKQRKLIVDLLACLVILVAGLTLSEYIFKWDAGIDNFFPVTELTPSGDPVRARMSASAAVIFILLNIVFILLHRQKFYKLIHGILITGLVVLSLTFLTYLSRNTFSGSLKLVGTALQASFVFLFLFIGTFYSQPLRHLRFSFQKRVIGFFTILLLLLIIVFLAMWRNYNRSENTNKLVDHTQEVLLQNQRIFSLLQDIENGTRGFIISGNENYLESFNMKTPGIHEDISMLKDLVKDNPVQLARIDTLGKLVDENIEARRQLILLRRTRGPEAAGKLFESGITKKLMDSLRFVLTQVENEENRLLQNRRAVNRQNMETSSRAIIMFQVLAVLLLLLSLMVIYNNIRARNKAEKDIRELNETLERRVEEKTREIFEKEKQYRFLLENMREGIQVIGFDWKYHFVNNSVVAQSKYSNEDLLGYTMMEKYPGIENTEMFRVLEQCMKDRTAQVFENEFTFPDGSKEWFELSIQPVPEGLFILSMDITQRKKAEAAIIASEETRRLIMDSALDAIVCIDVNSMVTVWTPQAEKVFGWKEEEAIGNNLTDMIIPGQYREKHKAGMEYYLQSGQGPVLNKLIEITAVNREGIEFPVELSIVPFMQRGKAFFCGFIRDISERKRSELLLKQLNETLVKRAEELQVSNQELERFAYVASHDLQEPLRMVNSFLNLLAKELEGKLDETTTQYFDFALDGSKRMKQLIQDLLQFSRLGSSKEPFTEIDCNEMLGSLRMIFNDSLAESGGSLQVNPLPVINGCYSQLQQVFQNLLANAIKYHDDKPPQIEVGAEEKNGSWQFYVKDNGIGIDPKFFDKIFIIFQRLHNKTEYSGTGIGLSICKKIVERHRGRIWVESEPSKGSAFYFTISKNIV